jgi:hypothetical protein
MDRFPGPHVWVTSDVADSGVNCINWTIVHVQDHESLSRRQGYASVATINRLMTLFGVLSLGSLGRLNAVPNVYMIIGSTGPWWESGKSDTYVGIKLYLAYFKQTSVMVQHRVEYVG